MIKKDEGGGGVGRADRKKEKMKANLKKLRGRVSAQDKAAHERRGRGVSWLKTAGAPRHRRNEELNIPRRRRRRRQTPLTLHRVVLLVDL